MEKDYLKFVIVGHVDHGKSTLIGRLLFDTKSIPQSKIDEVKEVCDSLGKPFEFAYLMDYLQEEREKNITIDTTQTFFNTAKRDYVIIDAPGHKEFLKNMITGSSLAEAAILIIDADEGIKEQTKRHAYILKLLNVNQLIVVINKMDKVEYNKNKFNEISEKIIIHLDELKIKPNYIIPISAKNGGFVANKSEKLSWFDGPTILEALDSFTHPVKESVLPLRFPIQDIYKDILVGRIESGEIKKNQEITILPAEQKAIVKKIKKWNQELETAIIGHSIGIILKENLNLKRGDIICDSNNLPKSLKNIKATIFWMSSLDYKIGDRLTIKCVTQEISCQIKRIYKLIDSSSLEIIDRTDEIKDTEVAEVEIDLKEKLVFDDFYKIPELGRFVLVRGDDIIAGGIISV